MDFYHYFMEIYNILRKFMDFYNLTVDFCNLYTYNENVRVGTLLICLFLDYYNHKLDLYNRILDSYNFILDFYNL